MSWSIPIPFRERSDPLTAVGELANTLETDEDCAAARQLVASAMVAGLFTAGELIDRLEALDSADRRGLLDACRGLAGLETATTIETRQRIEAANVAAQITAAAESPWRTCPAEGCGALPVNDQGAPIPTTVCRWWCPDHVDQAAEGDMRPRPPRIRMSESGALIEVDPDEEAREIRREESRRRLAEERREERAALAAELQATEQAARKKLTRELPEGLAA